MSRSAGYDKACLRGPSRRLLSFLGIGVRGVPRRNVWATREDRLSHSGVPEAEAREWEEALAREVARRTLLVAGHAEADPTKGWRSFSTIAARRRIPFIVPQVSRAGDGEAGPALRTPHRKRVPAELRKQIAQSYQQADDSGAERNISSLVARATSGSIAGREQLPAPPPPREPRFPRSGKRASRSFRYPSARTVPAPQLKASWRDSTVSKALRSRSAELDDPRAGGSRPSATGPMTPR